MQYLCVWWGGCAIRFACVVACVFACACACARVFTNERKRVRIRAAPFALIRADHSMAPWSGFPSASAAAPPVTGTKSHLVPAGRPCTPPLAIPAADSARSRAGRPWHAGARPRPWRGPLPPVRRRTQTAGEAAVRVQDPGAHGRARRVVACCFLGGRAPENGLVGMVQPGTGVQVYTAERLAPPRQPGPGPGPTSAP